MDCQDNDRGQHDISMFLAFQDLIRKFKFWLGMTPLDGQQTWFPYGKVDTIWFFFELACIICLLKEIEGPKASLQKKMLTIIKIHFNITLNLFTFNYFSLHIEIFYYSAYICLCVF